MFILYQSRYSQDLPGVPYYSLLMDAWFSIFTKKLPNAMEFAQFKGEKRQQGNTLFDKRRPFSYSGGCNLVVPPGGDLKSLVNQMNGRES
jgi:hypothetical protein